MERAQPSEAVPQAEIELEELLDSFLRLEGITDPVRRQIEYLEAH